MIRNLRGITFRGIMSKMIPVEGMDGVYGDTHSGAIVNKNNNDFQSYLKRREVERTTTKLR